MKASATAASLLSAGAASQGDAAEPSPAAARDRLVRLEQVGKTFQNGVEALREVDLEIRRGEFLALLGPSGCGKSTILRLLAGLANPSLGYINWASTEHDLGFVFQEPTLMPWANVFDNVWLPLRLRGQSRRTASAKVEEALMKVGLTGFDRAYPRELSGGMKMRVSLARAIVTRPSLLLMDEPFAALDEITRFKLNNDLLELWRAHRFTVIFVTHSVFESVYLSQRILVMAARPGRVMAEVSIDAPYPRDETFRTSALYGEFCHRVSHTLGEAIAA